MRDTSLNDRQADLPTTLLRLRERGETSVPSIKLPRIP